MLLATAAIDAGPERESDRQILYGERVARVVRSRALLAAVLLVALPLAGCSGLDLSNDPAASPADGDPIADDQLAGLFENATVGLNESATERVRAAVTADGAVTERGAALLERLVAIDELGNRSRLALARSVAKRGAIPEGALAAIDRVRTGSPAFQRSAFERGLVGVEAGLLDGEFSALGFQPDTYKPGTTELIERLAADGYGEDEIEYLRAVGSLSWGEWRQAERVGLLGEAITDGSVSEGTIDALADRSGDGLLDGYARALGLNATTAHEGIRRLTLSLAFEGIADKEWTYLKRAAERSTDGFAWTQAETFVYRDAADRIDAADRERLTDTSGDGLLDGFAERLGVDPDDRHERLRPYAARLAAPFELYTFNDIRYLQRLAELSDDEHRWAQATSFGLLADGRDEIGFVSIEQRRQLREFAPGVLNATARAIGLDERPEAAPVVRNLSRALVTEGGNATGGAGYSSNEVAYLERIVELAQYRGNEYEFWAQARELGLIEGAVADGEITDDELRALANADSDRLLNGLERAIGTDPERADTSGDGFPDHLVWGPMADLGMNASPTAVDIYVEVEATETVTIPESELAAVAALIEEGSTPDRPVRVHTYPFREDRAELETTGEMDDREATRAAPGYGMHYLLLQDRPFSTEEEVAGATQASRPERPQDRQTWMTVVADLSVHGDDPSSRAATIAHEMGHKFGILPYHFAGVDSFQYPAEEYDSVMNYRVTDRLTFSTGPPFDDYEQLRAAEFGSYDIDVSALEAIWEAGERPEESLREWLENTDTEDDR